jgi:hypothetical protein
MPSRPAMPAGGIPSRDEGAHSARISKRDYTAFCLIFTLTLRRASKGNGLEKV